MCTAYYSLENVKLLRIVRKYNAEYLEFWNTIRNFASD